MRTGVLLALIFACGGCGDRTLPPLASASRAGRTDEIRKLVASGADPNERSGVNGWTPLMHAIHKHQIGSAGALLDAGADVNARGRDGSTALMMAAGYGYEDMVALLLARGADAHLQLSDGENALTYAVLGVNDIDRFTAVDCQGGAIRALVDHVPDLKLGGSKRMMRQIAATKLKTCAGFAQLVGSRFP